MLASAAPARAPRAWQEASAASVIGVVLTVLLTSPTVRDFGSAGRFDSGDGRFSVWNVAWVAHALVDDPRHLFDANIFHPHRGTLAYSELNLIAGALAAPVYAATRHAAAAYNSAVLAGLFVAFVSMWALTRRLTGSAAAGLVSATGYAFSAYTAAHTAHVQLLMLFGFPLTMLAFHRLAERPTAGRGAWLGAALAVTALACGYYGVFAGGLLAVAVLLWARPSVAYWRAVVVAALVTAVLVLPAAIPFVRARGEVGAFRATSVQELRNYSASWRDYLTSVTVLDHAGLRALKAIVPAGLWRITVPEMVDVLFPGAVIGALALVGVVAGVGRSGRHRLVFGYLTIATLAAWASMGPAGGLYSLMMRVLPGISLLRAPARLGVVVIFALAVLAGLGVSELTRRRRWLVAVCLVAVAAEAWVPWPLRPMAPPERAYELLATLPRRGVVELPFPYIRSDFHRHTRAMLRSMINWQPLVNGYSDFIPGDILELAEPINGFPDRTSFDLLRERDVGYVIVRLSDYTVPEYRQRLLDRFPPYDKHLRLLSDDHDIRLYEIVSWP